MHFSKAKFKFILNLEKFGLKLGDTLQRLNEILYGVVEDKPYELNWEEIVSLYKKTGADGSEGSIEEFCFNYVVGYSLINGFSLDPALKEAMYIHLKSEVIVKTAKGEL